MIRPILPALILCVISACASPRGSYPAHWWKEFPLAGKPAWEILPQEAGPGEVILSKRNELGLLSNFAPTPFTYRGQRYASLEGFWQMMLYPEGVKDPRALDKRVKWPHTRAEVAAMTAFGAKKAGGEAEKNMATLGIDWVTFEGKRMPYRSTTPGEHHRLILEAMQAKLEQNEPVRQVLVATGTLVLRPDHHSEAGAPPEWRYYEVWTRLREKLKH